jgi:hypothetical protein
MIPPANLPTPVRTDGSNDFAHDTMVRRVPETIQRIRDVNPDYPQSIHDALKRLRDEIQGNAAIRMVEQHAPDFDHWLPQWRRIEGDSWLDTAWFFAEVYTYRMIMTAIRWYETQHDPFAPIKDEEYAGETLWRLLEKGLSVTGTPEEQLATLLHLALWGNRIDLSFADSLNRGAENVDADDLLANDTEAITKHLLDGSGTVNFIADNTGTELALDLALADALLQSNIPVTLHLKLHPTFVSDATVHDVWAFVARCHERGGTFAALARRLQDAFEREMLRLTPHPFWNSIYFLWEMPAHLADFFRDSRMTLVKGDANYRRIVGDALWPPDTPFSHVMGYFPSPIAALRTLKSDPIVGLKPGAAEQLDTIDPRWRVNGQRGVLQLKP